MSTLYRADNRRTADVPVAAADAQLDRAGAYLTDGVFLYRVVGLVAGERGEIVELEDCYWLDVVRAPVMALHERRLRVVTPAPVDG
jgi:hypothetical protein